MGEYTHGWMMTRDLHRAREPWKSGRYHYGYQDRLDDFIRLGGLYELGPLQVWYQYSRREGKAVAYVRDGNHRHLSAERAGIEWLPVRVRSFVGEMPPGLRRDDGETPGPRP